MKYIYDDGGRKKHFKGSAGDCVVRALSIFLNEDYKEIYDFAFFRTGKTPRNGVVNIGDIYFKKGLVYEEFSGYAGDYPLEEIEFNFIVQYSRHVHAVINKTIHDTHEKYNIEEAEGLWVNKNDQESLLKFMYPDDYKERLDVLS